MNERIQELIERSGLYLAPDNPEVFDKELEFFAELIVRECVDICNRIYHSNYPDADEWERSEEGDAIKQHFGVE